MIDLKDVFETYEDEYLKFDRVKSPMSKRPDLHAFLLLDKLVPDDCDIVCVASHDEFWIDIDCDQLAEVITADQVCELRRCGVRFDSCTNLLCMFA